jgi:nucleoid-associated protein YgaU
VKDGETLGEIASRELGSFKMWREIASLNEIADPSRIMPGRVLRMPTQKTVNVKEPVTLRTTVRIGERIHIVIDGDTMSSIAGEYYDDVNKYGVIVNANPKVDPNRLKIGTTLTIPKL